jgi:hypothetical protein
MRLNLIRSNTKKFVGSLHAGPLLSGVNGEHKSKGSHIVQVGEPNSNFAAN